MVVYKQKDEQQRKIVTYKNKEVRVLGVVAHNPNVSIYSIFHNSKIYWTSMQRILKRKFHSYKVSLHQELHVNDFRRRVTFFERVRDQRQINF